MNETWTTINLDGKDLHVYLGDDEFIIESPGRKGARARKLTPAGEEFIDILPAPIVPVREKPVWRGRISAKLPFARLIEADDIEAFSDEVTNLFPDPSSVMGEEEEAVFYDYLYAKQRYLIWKRYLSVVPPYAREIMDRFKPVYWRPVLQLLTECPASCDLYDSTPALFFLIAVCGNTREEKKNALDWPREDILKSFKLPGETWFIELIRKIPTKLITWELIRSLGDHGVLFGMDELEKHVREKVATGA